MPLSGTISAPQNYSRRRYGKSTKLIVPSELQNVATLCSTIRETLTATEAKEKQNDK